MKEPKLSVELIPASVFGSNVRSNVPKKEWDRLRKESYERANHRCEICNDSGLNQGYKHAVECHEIWDYNYKTKTQKLTGLISLCPRCHQIKHIGRTFAIGKQAEAFTHIEKINGWNHKEVVNYLAYCFIEHKSKSKINWKLDLNILREEFGVGKLEVSKGNAKRATTKKPFWRKKKKPTLKNKIKKGP